MKKTPAYVITSVDHALRLALMLQVEGPMRLSEASSRLGVAPSTAHRLLTMLVYRDFAVQGPDRRYAVGPVLTAGHLAWNDLATLRAAALPHLERLTSRVHETTNLMLLSGEHVRFLHSIESPSTLRVGSREGAVLSAHLASGGVALLAERPDAEIESFYSAEKFEGREGERPDVRLLLQRLAAARTHGFAINVERTEKGVIGIGRALRTPGEHTPAAISISLPSPRYEPEHLPRLVTALARAATDIEMQLATRFT